jgi:hypothetical protein
MRAAGLLILLGLTALVGVSCDGDSKNPASPTVTTAPTPRTIAQGNFALAAPTEDSVFFAVVPITDSSAGTWEATVDWTVASNALWMYVANGSCTVAQFASDDCPDSAACPCQFAVRSEVATPKPRVLTIPGAPGGTRTLIVVNLGPREDTSSYTVRLTPGSMTSAMDGGSGVSARGIAAPQVLTAPKAIR